MSFSNRAIILIVTVAFIDFLVGENKKPSLPSSPKTEEKSSSTTKLFDKTATIANSLVRFGFNKYVEVHSKQSLEAAYRQFSKGTKYCSRDKENWYVCRNLVKPYHCWFSHRRKERCNEFLATKLDGLFGDDKLKVDPCQEKNVIVFDGKGNVERHRQYVYGCYLIYDRKKKPIYHMIAHTRSGTFVFERISGEEITIAEYWLTTGRQRSYATMLGHRCLREMFRRRKKGSPPRNIYYR